MLTVIVILWELWDQNVTLLISFAFLTFTKVIVKYWSNQNTKEASADMSNHLNERMVKNLTNCRNQMSFDIIILSSFFFLKKKLLASVSSPLCAIAWILPPSSSTYYECRQTKLIWD